MLVRQYLENAWYEFLANENPTMEETIKWLAENTCLLNIWAQENGYKEIDNEE